MEGPIKPTAARDTPNTEEKVIVTLSPSEGDSSVSKRSLVLTRSVPVISIGRSSKVHSKGYVPAQDNAWFENPVMSRDHAMMMASFNETPVSVYITDRGSFHGTFHTQNDGRNKEQQIPPGQPVKMGNGDRLRFGMDIFRANKAYPPCSVDFHMEIKSQNPPNDIPRQGFTVPEYVDDDEDEDEENDGNAIPVLPNRPPQIKTKPRHTIDLTTNDDDLSILNPKSREVATALYIPSARVIDLTSEPDEPDWDSDIEAPASITYDNAPTAPQEAPRATEGKAVAPSTSKIDDADKHIYPYDMYDSDLDSEPFDLEEDDDCNIFGSCDQEDYEGESYPPSPRESTHSESIDGSDCSDQEDDDEDSIFSGLGPAGDKTIPVSVGLNSFKPSSRVAFPGSHYRDPSPSDAALVKRRPSTDGLSNSTRAHNLSEGCSQFSPIRADERVSVPNEHQSALLSSRNHAEIPKVACPNSTSEGEDILANSGVLSNPTTNGMPGDSASSHWEASGIQFLNSPASKELPPSLLAKPKEEEFDMTSAFQFCKSKLATTSSQTRRLPIQDLLAQDPRNPSRLSPSLMEVVNTDSKSATRKRSHDEAFNGPEEDIAPDCSNDHTTTISPPDDRSTEGYQPNYEVNSSGEPDYVAVVKDINVAKPAVQDLTPVSTHLDTPRPTKRVRMATVAVQFAACMALGGAATFSYLVHTAPVL